MDNQLIFSVLHLLIHSLLLSSAFEGSQVGENRETLGCRTRGVFLSLNRTLAPLDMVSSSDDAFGYPATYIYNFGHADNDYFRTWCTTDNDLDPYIEMELTSPVLITQILFGGRFDPDGSYHVTNLTLEYSPPNNTTVLSYYTTETGSIKYFTAPHLNTLIPLEHPLLTKRLRLRPVEWFAYDSTSFVYVCLGVGLYGCLATEAVTLEMMSTTVEDQLSSSKASPTTMDSGGSGSSETAAQTITNVVRDYQALAIVLPIALLATIINVLLIGVSVYICAFLRRQRENNQANKSQCYENLEWSSKSLELNFAPEYVNSQSKGSDRKASVVKKVDNPIYGSSPEVELHTNVDANIYMSASETGYEPIDHDTHTINETDEEEMLDNLAYGVVDHDNKDTINETDEEEMLDNLAYGGVDHDNKDIGEQLQCEAAVELKDNESYNPVSSMSAQDQDEGEYSYPTFTVSPAQTD